MLVSVPLRSVGKEVEGLNVFAALSQVSLSWKDFPPFDNHLFEASTRSASLWSTRNFGPMRKISMALLLQSQTTWVTGEAEEGVDSSFSMFS